MQHVNEKKGSKVKPTEHPANTASRSKMVRFAMLCALFHIQGSGVSSVRRPGRTFHPFSRLKCCVPVLLSAVVGALAFTVAPALAAAPETPTLELSGRAAESVSLSGVLSPNKVNEEGTYEILYKKSPTECTGGSHGIQGSMALAEQGQPVSETISGLEAGAEYTFCLVDTNTALPHEKATSTPPLTVTTAVAPEKPEKAKVKPGSITATTVEVEGELNHLKARASEPGTFEVLYKVTPLTAAPTGECEENTISDPATGAKEEKVSAKLEGLQPNAKYTFCLRARNEATPEGETSAVTGSVTFNTPVAPATIESISTSNVKATEATLEGTVNPNNQLTECHFQYVSEAEFTANYEHAVTIPCSPELLTATFGGQSVSPTKIENGGTVPAPIGGLTEGTTYKYRIVTKNGKGEEAAKEGTAFTTAIPPTTPITEAATGPTETVATLHGVLNPTEANSEPGNYQFFYKASATECEITQSEREKGVPQLSTTETSATGKKQSAEATAEGLLPGTTYSFCLRALNGASEPALGNAVTFTTLAVGPTVAENSTNASEVTATSAELNAQVNPGGGVTTYHFEYIDQAGYEAAQGESAANLYAKGASTPESGSIGSDDKEHPALATVGGLRPSTVYHYRVVAHNAAGGGAGSTADGPDETFTTQVASGEFTLPDNRQWEQVSPVNKHGARIEAITKEGGIISAAQEGGAMTYVANAPLGEPAGNRSLAYSQILSLRGHDGGWSTSDLAPPDLTQPRDLVVGELDEYFAFSPNLSSAVLEPHDSPPLSPLAKENSVLLREDLLEPALGAVYNPLVNDQNTPPGTGYGGRTVTYVAASENLEHIILESTTQLTNTPGSGLYEWNNGVLTPISILPNEEFISRFNAKLGDLSRDVRHAISENGSLVFWSTITGGGDLGSRLYVREVAEGRTVEIDLPQGVAPPVNPPEASFQYATPDGERVYFKDGQRLTADSTAERGKPELYEYDVNGPPGEQLTDLTPNPEGLGVGPQHESSDVQGEVIGASDNGEYVYLISSGALNSETAPVLPGRSPEEEAARVLKLYVIHTAGAQHTPTLITSLTGADEHDFEKEEGHEQVLEGLTSRMSPDGQFLEFMSDLPMKSSRGTHVAGYDNRDAVSGQADEEVFEYDAATNETLCVSCNPSGARPHGVFDPGTDDGSAGEGIGLLVDRSALWEGRWLAGSVPGWTPRKLEYADYQSRYLSDDGRLFFDSADALVPEDSNGKEDVYEYEPAGVGTCAEDASSGSDVFVSGAGGCVGLISAGTSSKESAFLDASESGDDVFFLTATPLAGSDIDDADDVYDAHVCSGGAPCAGAAVVVPPCTTEASCKAAPVPQPAIFGAPASSTFSGQGNVAPTAPAVKPKVKAKPVKCKKRFVRKKDKCLRRKAGKKAGKSNRKGRK